MALIMAMAAPEAKAQPIPNPASIFQVATSVALQLRLNLVETIEASGGDLAKVDYTRRTLLERNEREMERFKEVLTGRPYLPADIRYWHAQIDTLKRETDEILNA